MRAALFILVAALFLAEPAYTQPSGSAPQKENRNKHFWRDNSIMYGGLWAFTFTVNYKGLGHRFPREASFKKFGKNFISLPEFKDGDSSATNYIAHPLFGAFTYYVFRRQGYTARQSFGATVLQSALFEYAVEGFVERPSGIDLIVTPLVGAPLGAKAGKYVVPASALVVVIRFAFW